MSALINLRKIVSLSDDELHLIGSHFSTQKINKNESFLKIGEVCRKVALIEKGAFVYLKVNAQGEEIAADFVFEGDWVTYYYSLLTGRPSDMEIRAMEDTLLVFVTFEDLNKLYEQIPQLERVGRILAEQNFIIMAERTLSLQSKTAAERYEELIESKPLLLQKVPQYHIASYLGIKPQSLSRLRRK